MNRPFLLACALPLTLAAQANDSGRVDGETCTAQANRAIARLEAEVVGRLDPHERTAANRIVIDVCAAREKEVREQVQAQVEQAREQERENSNAWLTESADKPGHRRLKRKGSY